KRKFPIPESSTSSSSAKCKTKKATGKKAHMYSTEEETFIAQQLANVNTWNLLLGPGEANAYNKPKTGIRQEIADKFNLRFSTSDNIVSIDEAQLKNKIHTMKSSWTAANRLFKKTGNGDKPGVSLREKVEKQCHFYYLWLPFASSSLNMNPQDPVELTKNISRRSAVADMDDSDFGESSEDDEDVGAIPQVSETPPSPKEQRRRESARSSKKQKKYGADMIHLVEDLRQRADEDREIQQENANKELDLKRQRLELEKLKFERDQRFEEMRMEREQRLADIRIEKELLELERAKAEVEVLRAKAASLRSKVSEEVEIVGSEKVTFRKSVSPVSSPK
ncbi:hypothetical protein BGX20_003051, partial [Mortierella sp. AD010]